LTLWALESQWEVFGDVAEVYAGVFGEAGLRRFREVVSEEWSALPVLTPGETVQAAGGYRSSARRGTLEWMRLSFAETAEEQVEVLCRDLSTPRRFVAVAGVLGDAGRFDEALGRLREAQAAFGAAEHGREGVDRAVADILRHAGRHEEAVEAEWDCFRRRPGLSSFQRFAEQLRSLPDWGEWRAKALALLELPVEPGSSSSAHDFSSGYGNTRLVEVLLWDGDIEGAWAAAQRGGCTSACWMQVARARAATHPAESIPVLVRAIDAARSGATNRKTYSAVAHQVAELRDWHRRAGTEAEFTDYLLRVRNDHRNRPAFQDELDKAGLR
jgi:hypothetical protein